MRSKKLDEKNLHNWLIASTDSFHFRYKSSDQAWTQTSLSNGGFNYLNWKSKTIQINVQSPLQIDDSVGEGGGGGEKIQIFRI